MKKIFIGIGLLLSVLLSAQVPPYQRNAITTNVVPLVAGANITFTPLGSNIISISAAGGGGGVTLAQVTNVLQTASISNSVANSSAEYTNVSNATGSYFDANGLFNITDSSGAALNYNNGILAMINGTYFGSNAVLNLFYGTGTDPISINGTINNYQEVLIQNLSSGNAASSDFVAINDLSNGSDTNRIVDMGINSSGNNQNAVGAAGDAYLYAGNYVPRLWIGTAGPTNVTSLFAGGVSTNGTEQVRITPNGTLFINPETNLSSLTVAGNFIPELVGPSKIPYVNGSTQMVALTVGSGLTLSGGTLSSSAGGGSVTSVALADNAQMFSVTGSPITGSGTLGITFTNVPALSSNNVFAGNMTVAGSFLPESVGPSAFPYVNSSTQMVAGVIGTNLNNNAGTLTSTNLFLGLDSGVASSATFVTGTTYILGPNAGVNASTTEGRYTFILPVACHIVGYAVNVYGGTIAGGPAPVTTQLSINSSFASASSVAGTKFGSSSFLVQNGYSTNIVVSGLNQVATNGSTLCLQFACGSYTTWTSGEVRLSVLCQYP